MKLKKLLTNFITFSIVINCISAVFGYKNKVVYADDSVSFFQKYVDKLGESEAENNFTDTSHMSDEEFFGAWDNEAGEWINKGKLNYDYSSDLAEVERLVKLNSYDLAKEELFEYYKNRASLPQPKFEGTISWAENILNMKDAYCFDEKPLTVANVTNTTEEYQEYVIDIMGVVKHGVFLLSSIDKTTDMIELASRETEYSPSLLVLKEDGTQVTLYPVKDTYIRGGEYQNAVYGESEKLYIKDSYTDNGDGTYKPYSSQSRRTYIAFDAKEIPSDATRMYLTINARIVPETDEAEITDNNIEFVVFDAYNQSWDELEKEENEFSPMTWANYKISHYSWNGLPGGFDYRRPENVPSEWQNYNTRFYNVVSLAKSALATGNPAYMPKSISGVLDFINDTNGLIASTNMPGGRDFESMARTREASALIFTYLDTEIFNSEALIAMLKWLWEEMTYLYNGAGCLYEGATDIPQSNNYAETNRGLWHCEAMLTVCAYMPEYSDRDMWKELADKRLKSVVDVLINDDGCYQEATFGYPRSVLVDCIDLWNKLEGVGEEVPKWYTDKVKLFAKYMMNISYPNHTPPNYGEGDAGSTVSALKNYLDVVDDETVEYVITDGAEGVEPDYTSAYFEKLQLAACRTGWKPDASMLIMSAKNGGNHNHKDSLHMMYYFDGLDLLADTGMTSYDSGHPHFQWQRHKTRSHNTIEIDGIAQRGSDFLYNDSKDELKWNGLSDLNLYTSDAVDRIEAWTDANKGFRHYRNVSYIKNRDFLIVSDMVKGSSLELARQYYFDIVNYEMDEILKGRGKQDAFTPAPNLKEFLTTVKNEGIKIGLVTSGLYEKAMPEIISAFKQLDMGDPVDFYDSIITAGYALRKGQTGTLGDMCDYKIDNLMKMLDIIL